MEKSESKNCLFVGNLSPKCTKTDLFQLFNKFGEIIDICIQRQPMDSTLKLTYGFVRFLSATDASVAKAASGLVLFGEELKIGWALSDYTAHSGKLSFTKRTETSSQVHVSFISEQTDILVNEDVLYNLFSAFGPVVDVRLVRCKIAPPTATRSICQSGHGFIHYPQDASGVAAACAAIAGINQHTVDQVRYDCEHSHKMVSHSNSRNNSPPLPVRSFSQSPSPRNREHLVTPHYTIIPFDTSSSGQKAFEGGRDKGGFRGSGDGEIYHDSKHPGAASAASSAVAYWSPPPSPSPHSQISQQQSFQKLSHQPALQPVLQQPQPVLSHLQQGCFFYPTVPNSQQQMMQNVYFAPQFYSMPLSVPWMPAMSPGTPVSAEKGLSHYQQPQQVNNSSSNTKLGHVDTFSNAAPYQPQQQIQLNQHYQQYQTQYQQFYKSNGQSELVQQHVFGNGGVRRNNSNNNISSNNNYTNITNNNINYESNNKINSNNNNSSIATNSTRYFANKCYNRSDGSSSSVHSESTIDNRSIDNRNLASDTSSADK